jgi:hypothetical protein
MLNDLKTAQELIYLIGFTVILEREKPDNPENVTT